MRVGFAQDDWEKLASALVDHCKENEVSSVSKTAFGTKYIVEGLLQTPVGRRPLVRSVWVVETADVIPRLVTAFPVRRRAK